MLRTASLILALALPSLAQDPAANATAENLFYKAFYLEKAERDQAGAMALYEKFLSAAPDHRLAKTAAQNCKALLERTGKTKDAEAFAKKHEKLLGAPAVVAAPADAATPPDRPRGARGEGRGRGEGGAGPGNMEERVKELETQLAAAKEAGNEEDVQRLTRQIERMKQMGERGGQAGGRGAGGRGGRGMLGNVKFAEMSAEQMGQFKERLDGMGTMIERLRENGMEERAKQMEDGIKSVKTALEANKLEDAQKAYDKMLESMRGRGR